jgi:DNA invertase Pin-like site-specific DNA recombinase
MMPNNSPFSPGDKVVAYCRYSEGDDQGLKNTSVDEQEAEIRRFCLQNSLQLVQVYADPFASGRSVAKRDKYLEMLSDLLHKKRATAVAGVILWDFERYGRNYDRAQYDAAQLRMKGYKLFSMQQPITDNSPFAHVLESMYFASAQNQSDMISADVKRALQSNFTKYGVIPRTNIPDGWQAVPVKMGYYTDGRERIGYKAEPDPQYIDRIRKAIDARLDGATISDMREILGDVMGSCHAKVVSLMKKPLLYGQMTYGGTTIDDYCAPIINKDTFDRLQAYNATSLKRKRSPGCGVYSLNRSMLSGLLVCAECGEHMHLDRRKAKGHTYETYYCNHYHYGIRREIIEPFILDKCIELLTGDQYKTDQETLLDALLRELPTEADNSTLKAEIAQIDRKLARVTNAIADLDTPSGTLILKLKELEEEKREKQRQLTENEKGIDIEKIRATSDRIRDSILAVLKNENSTADALRDAVSTFVAEIVVSKVAGITIRHGLPGYTPPSQVADDPRQKFVRPSAYKTKTYNGFRTVTHNWMIS